MSDPLRLLTRSLPYEVGMDLILAEAAALLVWALDHDAGPRDETWLRLDPDRHRLEVGVPVAATAPEPPEGLELRCVALSPAEGPASAAPGQLRAALRTTRYARIEHDPADGRPLRAWLYAERTATPD